MSAELQALKERLKATWAAGDFGAIARSYERGAAEFVQRLELAPGVRVLDVACGTGNLALPAARAGAAVSGIDIVPNLVEQARARAANERLAVRFDEGDAETLPYANAAFDVVISMFGVMFCPRPDVAAAELVRVCRHGGKIALASWTPASFIGQIFKTTATFVPPPAGMPSPVLWGDEPTVRSRLGEGVATVTLNKRMMAFDFAFPVPEVVEFWRQYYGPTHRAFAALDDPGQARYRAALEALWSEHNRAANDTTHVESEYLEVIAVRAA